MTRAQRTTLLLVIPSIAYGAGMLALGCGYRPVWLFILEGMLGATLCYGATRDI